MHTLKRVVAKKRKLQLKGRFRRCDDVDLWVDFCIYDSLHLRMPYCFGCTPGRCCMCVLLYHVRMLLELQTITFATTTVVLLLLLSVVQIRPLVGRFAVFFPGR